MELEAVIGLEIHVQLRTKSKMFCSCDNASEGAAPNTLICPICTGHPGTLPVPNQQAIRWTVMAAQALGCTIPEHAKFDRKHYFYPDLPKGYQISQYDEPIGVHGSLTVDVDGHEQTIGITRIHLEEDVGKLFHQGAQTLVDYNRAGTPLLEIVTEPDIRSPDEAKALLQELRLTTRYLGISDADMEKGQLRCDVNFSMRPKGDKKLYPKSEIKNLNSFKAVKQALENALDKSSITGVMWQKAFEKGSFRKEFIPASRTFGWVEDKQQLAEQRAKESEADYRYFPEPDIPPLHFTPEFLTEVQAETPELPAALRVRLAEMYDVTAAQANILIADRELAKYFEEVVSEFRAYAESELGVDAATNMWAYREKKSLVTHRIANWLINRVTPEERTRYGLVPAADLARLLWMVHQRVLYIPAAHKVYVEMLKTKKGPHALVEELGLGRIGDAAALEAIVQKVLADHPDVVEQYRQGKTAVLQFLVGQVMKETRGRADAEAVRNALGESLNQP